MMRFYFQDAGQKVATKCIRVSSTATAHDVINTLIEKFRPDIRMLSVPEYAIYEIHENGGTFNCKHLCLYPNSNTHLICLFSHTHDCQNKPDPSITSYS